jgi:hypothetical protein
MSTCKHFTELIFKVKYVFYIYGRFYFELAIFQVLNITCEIDIPSQL